MKQRAYTVLTQALCLQYHKNYSQLNARWLSSESCWTFYFWGLVAYIPVAHMKVCNGTFPEAATGGVL